MEKSSTVILSKEEIALIKGNTKFTKSAGYNENTGVPTRFVGWYSHDELKDIANEQD